MKKLKIMLIILLVFAMPVCIYEYFNLPARLAAAGNFYIAEYLYKSRYLAVERLCFNDKDLKWQQLRPCLQDLIWFYRATMQYNKAVDLYNKHIKKGDWELLPDRIVSPDKQRNRFIVHIELANLYLNLKMFNSARKNLDIALQIMKQNPGCAQLDILIYSALANYYLAVNQPDNALKYAEKTSYINHNETQKHHMHYLIGKIYLQKKLYNKAEKYLKLALDTPPDDFLVFENYLVYKTKQFIDTNNLFGILEKAKNNPNKAKKYFENSVALSKFVNSKYILQNICSINNLYKINKQLQIENEYIKQEAQLLQITKPMPAFKNLNAAARLEKIDEYCK